MKVLWPVVLALVVWLSLPLSAQSETSQKQADVLFQEGYTLYQQYYSPNAFGKFKQAAQLGHAEAAYYAGNILRRNHTYITEEAEQFYRQAAEGGDVYAMLRLAQKGNFCGTLQNCDYDREEWLDRAFDAALPRAKAGDTGAMMALSSAYAIKGDRTADFEWVERAAENGHAFAQYWMAVMLDEQERGFYWTERGRRAEVLKWLKASAAQGFPKAMLKLALELRDSGQLEEARYWVEAMGKADYYHAILESGASILYGPDAESLYGEGSGYGFPEPRPVEGAAILLALHRQTGKDAPLNMIEVYRDKLTPEIMAKAEARSKELLVDTPIIYYLPKFGI